jgi:hypothetical protein
MDLADKSDNAIIRPGLVPCWRLVVAPKSRYGFEAFQRARQNSHFGAGTAVTNFEPSSNCCGAIFVAEDDGAIPSPEFWELEYFFARDRGEARVFEYDRWQRNFVARRLDEIRTRKKTS